MLIDRRIFFKKVLNGLIAINVFRLKTFKGLLSYISPSQKKDFKTKVFIIKNRSAKNYNKKVFFDMFNSSGINWFKLFNKDDVVGIKVNSIAGPNLSPHPELIEAIIDCLRLTGIQENRIIIWDRSTRELNNAGFKVNERMVSEGLDVRCFGTDSPLAGYDEEITVSGKIGSCYSRIVTDLCTALINVSVLKDHDLAGVSLSMKNYYGAIHNPNKYHDSNCSPYVADICASDVLKKKTKLVICDGITAQYHGGPGYKPQWIWKYNGILVSSDMVALDSVGTYIIEEKRKNEKMQLLKDEGRFPVYLKVASDKEHNIGVCELDKIEIIERWV